MKPTNTNTASLISKSRALILLGALAAVATTVACNSKPKPVESSSQPAGETVRPTTLGTFVRTASPTVPVNLESKTPATAVKSPLPKLITYKSRDYGVSFTYPRQYAYVSAKAISLGNESLKPKSDGDEGQFTLARIEIPKGFYPDTDLESGYFTLSLNQDISDEQCASAFGTGNSGKVETKTINGVEFQWVETEVSGGGNASKTRNYAAYNNGTCYEVELGVKTKNEQGLAREVDPDQVIRRLDAILETVKLQPNVKIPATQQVISSVEVPKADAQK